jgi:Fe-S cluster biogenesis protein NfuA
METRILRALEKVRPYLHSHGGDVEFLNVTGGVVRLKLLGSCGSCPSSSVTLKNAVEEALYEAAPDIEKIEAETGEAELNASKLVVLK